MLSRVADALYWMARYVERAETAARILEVTRRFQVDIGELEPQAARAQWQRTARVLGFPEDTPLEAAVLAHDVPGSVASLVFRARENARQVQEVISSEMWDYLNQTHWALTEAAQLRTKREVLSGMLAEVIKAGFLWSGVADATVDRGPSWQFIRLGQFVERLDLTGRLCIEHWTPLSQQTAQLTPDNNVGWLTWLRACGSLEGYRKRYPTRLEPRRVLGFLVLDDTYPRSMRYSARAATRVAERLLVMAPARGTEPARAFGKLASQIDFADVDEILEVTPEAFLRAALNQLNRATLETQRAYFLH